MTLPLGRPIAERGPTPLWFEIKERLRRAILDGTYKVGDRLPTEAQLIEHFGVSRITVRTALDHLERERLIVRGSGRGTFVRLPVVEQPVHSLAGFHEDMRARGLQPSSNTLSVLPVAGMAQTRRRLAVLGDDPLLYVERLLLADDEPMALQRSWLPRWVLGGGRPFTPEELDSGSLYDLLDARSGARPARAEEIIQAAAADSSVATSLAIPVGSPILLAHRLCFDAAERPVEDVDVFYRADRYRYRVELSR